MRHLQNRDHPNQIVDLLPQLRHDVPKLVHKEEPELGGSTVAVLACGADRGEEECAAESGAHHLREHDSVVDGPRDVAVEVEGGYHL